MARVAFVGLGTMGRPLAGRLVAAGHEVAGCDADPDRAAVPGVEVAATPAAAASGAEIAFLSLPSPAAVEDVVLGSRGLATVLAPGAVAVDMSTSPPALARRLAAALRKRGVDFLDAPVSGGPAGAESGTLAIMVGGPPAVFERCLPLLEAMGGHVRRVGGHGAGQALKLGNNLVVACTMAALVEACALLEREGIEPALAYEVLTRSTGDSAVLRRRFPLPGVRPEHPASRGYEPMFRLDLLAKDLGLVLDVAADDGVPMAVGRAAADAYATALAAGLGGLDYSALYLARRPQS